MSAKSKNTAKAIDRPFDPAILAKARKIAEQYQVIVAFEDGHWYGRGLELPGIHGDGKTVEPVRRRYPRGADRRGGLPD